MYPPGQVAEILDVSPSTLRRWAGIFKGFLSDHARKRRRMYTEADIATLSQVKELIAKGDEIKDIPQKLDAVVVDQPDQEEKALSLPGLISRMDEYSSLLDHTASRVDRLDTSSQQSRDYDRRLYEYLRLPWWRRIFQKPPEPPE